MDATPSYGVSMIFKVPPNPQLTLEEDIDDQLNSGRRLVYKNYVLNRRPGLSCCLTSL